MRTDERIIRIMPLPNVHDLHEVILATARRQAETTPQGQALAGTQLNELLHAIAANVAMVVHYRCEVALEGEPEAVAA